MIHAHDINHVHDMTYGILYGSITTFLKETAVHTYLSHTTGSSQCTHLVIGKVTGMVTQRTA
jgi:hypothetical protein